MARKITVAAEQLDLFGSHAERAAEALLPPADLLDGHLSFATEDDASFSMRMTSKEARSLLPTSGIEFNLDAIASGLPASVVVPAKADDAMVVEGPLDVEPSAEVLQMMEEAMKPYNDAMDAISDATTDVAPQDGDEEEDVTLARPSSPWSDEATDEGIQADGSALVGAALFDDPLEADLDAVAAADEGQEDRTDGAHALQAAMDDYAGQLSTRHLGHSRYSVLTQEEQRELLSEYASTKSPAAMNKLLCANAKLANSRAMAYYRKVNNRIRIEDLFQAGMVGLYEAIERFDLSQNTRLSTYATWHIDKQIKALGRFSANLLYVPVHVFRSDENIQLHSERMARESGGKKSAQEFADKMTADRDSAYSIRAISGDAPIGWDGEEDSSSNLFSMIACESMGPEERAHISSMLNLMQSAFESAKRSSARAQEPIWHGDAFLLRFGLDDENLGAPMTLPEVLAVVTARGEQGRYPGCVIPGTGEACRRAVDNFKENFLYHLGRHYSKDGEDLPEELSSVFGSSRRSSEERTPAAQTPPAPTPAALPSQSKVRDEVKPVITKPARTSLLNR